MKELDPLVFLSVFQEMLGWMFWPVVAGIVLIGLAFLVLLIRDRGLESRRFVRAQLIGLAGGFLAIAFMLWTTQSRLSHILGGPIDWLLAVGIWAAGAVGAAMFAYVAMGLVGLRSAR